MRTKSAFIRWNKKHHFIIFKWFSLKQTKQFFGRWEPEFKIFLTAPVVSNILGEPKKWKFRIIVKIYSWDYLQVFSRTSDWFLKFFLELCVLHASKIGSRGNFYHYDLFKTLQNFKTKTPFSESSCSKCSHLSFLKYSNFLLHVIIMSPTHLKVNLHSIVVWMSRNSLL